MFVGKFAEQNKAQNYPKQVPGCKAGSFKRMEKCPVFFLAFDNRRNSENVDANNLMEKILAKDNMNQA